MHRALVLMPVLILAGNLAIAQDKGTAGKQKSLNGTWKAISIKGGGKELPAEKTQSIRFKFMGDRLTMTIVGQDRTKNFKIKLDAGKKPKAIDFIELKDGKAKKTVLGIYKIKGNTLTLCINEEKGGARPAKFESLEGSRFGLAVFERAKK